MENRFAGAQNSGQRRRRRLATDDEQADVDTDLLAQFSPAIDVESGRVTDPTTLGIVGRMIPQKFWQHALFLLVLAAGLLALGWQQSATSDSPMAEPLLLPCVAGLLLLFAGQLSVLTGWLREESVVDFRGRYRWWHWLGVGMIVLGLLFVTNTFQSLPDIVATIVEPLTGPVIAARPALVGVPALAFCLVVFSRVLPDMSRSLITQTLFVIALLAAVLRQMLMLNPAHPSISPATLDAILITSAFFLFASMLLHCRFVAYICNDPPVSACAAPTLARKAMQESLPETTSKADCGEAVVELPAVQLGTKAARTKNSAPKATGKRRRSKRKAA